MTRSSTNEIFTPLKDPKREFRSSRKHFKTLSLDELRSPDFNLFSDQEYSKEEVAETMAETMSNNAEDIKVPLILGRPFLSIARAKIDVYKRKITLRVGEERIIFTSVKPASSLIKRVYMLSLRERMELDLEARLIGETLVINRSFNPLNGDYIELNDLNEPFELRRNQGDDLMPTIEECGVIKEFKTKDDELDTGIDDYPRNNVVGALIKWDLFLLEPLLFCADLAVLVVMDVIVIRIMGDVVFGKSIFKRS
ncbi:hypothetical protein Tco_0309205 [Tanacetum coccineum]